MSVTINGKIATDTETGLTYGKRCRKPSWIQEFENSGAKEIHVSKSTQTKQKIVNEINDPGPFEWHLISEMNNQCVIVANDAIDALLIAGKSFNTPVTSTELQNLWKKKPHKKDGCSPVGSGI